MLIAVLGVLGIETDVLCRAHSGRRHRHRRRVVGVACELRSGTLPADVPSVQGRSISISAAGVSGTVREIGLFVTAIDTPDQVLTFVGNNRLFADNVQNFSANPFRRVTRRPSSR